MVEILTALAVFGFVCLNLEVQWTDEKGRRHFKLKFKSVFSKKDTDERR